MTKKSRLVLFVVIVFAVIIAIIIRYQLDKYIIAECKAEYLKIKDQFVYARYRNNEYELWTSDEYFVLSEKEFIEKNKSLEKLHPLEFGTYGYHTFILLDDNTIVAGGSGNIFYIDIRTKKLLRHLRMPDRKGVYFDIYNDKDLIFIFEGDVYIYDYESDITEKQESIDIKDFFKKHKLFLFSNKIAYSKKYNIMLYHAEATVDESNHTFGNEIFAINFNTGETSFLGYGNHPYKDAAGELYYASNNIIYRYDPEENKTIEFFTHKKTLFEYSDIINGFIILENTLFIFTSGNPDFKEFKGCELIIYTDKNRLRLKSIIFTDGAYEMEKQKRFLSSFAGIDIIRRR